MEFIKNSPIFLKFDQPKLKFHKKLHFFFILVVSSFVFISKHFTFTIKQHQTMLSPKKQMQAAGINLIFLFELQNSGFIRFD